jgi:hypothetical protein
LWLRCGVAKQRLSSAPPVDSRRASAFRRKALARPGADAQHRSCCIGNDIFRSIMKKTVCAFITAVSLWAAPAHAATDTQLQDAYRLAQTAITGDSSQIPAAVEKLTALLAGEPANPLLLVHLGALTAMQARGTMLPWKKTGYAEDGMAMQDKALGLLSPATDAQRHDGVPVTLQVKFTAASTFVAVPRLFNRHERGERLLREVLDSPLFEPSPLGFRGAVWMSAARLARDDGKPEQARNYLDTVIAHNAPQADQARAQREQVK